MEEMSRQSGEKEEEESSRCFALLCRTHVAKLMKGRDEILSREATLDKRIKTETRI